MWGGRGDHRILAEAQHGFKTTSMSMNLFLQPEPLLSELLQMAGNDGFLDRILFVCVKPHLYFSRITRKAARDIKTFGENVISTALMSIFANHKEGVHEYTFEEDAQELFDELVDNHVRDVNSQYDSPNGM